MFERFTDEARRVVVLAQQEARRLDHDHIGTEHVLLGLLAVPEGVAARALAGLGVAADAVRGEVEQVIGRGTRTPEGHIPFTPRAKKVLELSLREAMERGDNFIGAEHILLAVAREGEGVGAQVLARVAGGLDRVREAVGEHGGGPGSRLPTIGGTTAWLEVYADDVPRAVAFYRRAFGWTARPAGDYVDAEDTGGEVVDGQLLVSTNGRIVAAVVPRPAGLTAPAADARGCVVYLPVGDATEAAAAAVAAGGAGASPPRRVDPLGTLAQVRDTEGNLIGLCGPVR
jgi:predicted enzyme related to lactoylglutathione lyase